MPEIFQNLAQYFQEKGIEPRNTIIDNRTEEQKEQALMGVEDTSLNEKLLPYKQSPHLLFSTQKGDPTDPSLYHSEALGITFVIFRNPEDVE